MENEEKSKLTLDRYYADYLEKKIDFGRHLWLAFILLTVVNIVMFVADWGVTVLTAAVVPYNLVVYCKGLDNGFVDGAWPEIGGFTLMALISMILSSREFSPVVSRSKATNSSVRGTSFSPKTADTSSTSFT